jgi:pimeloyl-ACP methyl ester carboxylesterase
MKLKYWLCLAFACVTSAHAVPPKTDTLKDCGVDGIASEVSCGAIKRAINPDAPTEQFVLHYVVIPALVRVTQEPPLFFLAGGPGQSAISFTGPLSNLLGRLNQRRDLVIVDQRGTGKSLGLYCAKVPKQTPLATQLDPSFMQAQWRQCQDQLTSGSKTAPPVDLRFFSTTLAMQDLDAVRQALGYSMIDLIGGSYGTRAALEYQRLYPAQVRRMVLDGLAPPDMVLPMTGDRDAQTALQGVFDRCKADASCATAYPNLQAKFEAWIASFPRSFTMNHPVTHKEEKVNVTQPVLLSMLRSVLYVPSLAAALPYVLNEAMAGRLWPLAGLAGHTSSGNQAQRLAEGMHYSVICSEDAPRMPAQAAQDKAMVNLYSQICAKWPKAKIDPDFYSIKEKKTGAVLLLSGGADPVTPPVHGQRVANALGPLAKHIVVPNVGHGVMGVGCMPDLLYQFFNTRDNAKALQIEPECLTRVPAPLFYLPTQSKESNRD